MRVEFDLAGQRYEAECFKTGARNTRIGWPMENVPPLLVGRSTAIASLPGWLTLLVPTAVIRRLPDAAAAVQKKQLDWANHKRITLQRASPKSQVSLYVNSLNENLFEPLGDDARAEFQQGDGRELWRNMRALYSSSALACNVFAYWKTRDPGQIAHHLGIPQDGILSLTFEQKFAILSSGKSPNLDVTFNYRPQRVYDCVGIETKFKEPFPARFQKLFDHKYFVPGNWWDGLPATRALAESFRGDGEKFEQVKRHLHRGQLIKHILGLRSACRRNGRCPSRVRLKYLWYDLDLPEARCHEREIEAFAAVLAQDGVEFEAITWQVLIRRLIENERERHTDYVDYLVDRYL